MQTLPSSLIPYFIGTIVFAIFAWRAYRNYRKLHNPLSGYFGLIAGSISIAFGTWSIPLFFTRDVQFVKFANIVGDFFLYVFFVICADFVYYLALQNHISKKLYRGVIGLLALVGWCAHVYGYQQYGIVVTDLAVDYKLPTLASVVELFFLVDVLLVGILVLKKLPEQSGVRGRQGLIGISVLFILSSLAGAANIVMSEGYSNSPLIVGTYMGAFIFFVAVLVLVRLGTKKSR